MFTKICCLSFFFSFFFNTMQLSNFGSWLTTTSLLVAHCSNLVDNRYYYGLNHQHLTQKNKTKKKFLDINENICCGWCLLCLLCIVIKFNFFQLKKILPSITSIPFVHKPCQSHSNYKFLNPIKPTIHCSKTIYLILIRRNNTAIEKLHLCVHVLVDDHINVHDK